MDLLTRIRYFQFNIYDKYIYDADKQFMITQAHFGNDGKYAKMVKQLASFMSTSVALSVALGKSKTLKKLPT